MPSLELSRIKDRLHRLYGPGLGARAARFEQLLIDFAASYKPPTVAEQWSQRDVVLITYADQVWALGRTPLAALHELLVTDELHQRIAAVHLLPFFPSSSDDGFSVIDYLAVDPHVGRWDDVARLAQQFHLMFDLVLNHVSQKSAWFQNYLRGESPFDRFFIEVDPDADLSQVVRPRSLPLLTPFETTHGRRHVWTTFSADQIDLNYSEPEVLLRMLDVLLEYIRRGARIVRLDAVAFLWKQIGTSCIHLRQTHEVVKLMRDVVSAVAPHVLLLTETNVPHEENVSYFGGGDEAHMVYQFSLPPLLLDAVVSHDATYLARWLGDLEPPRPGSTYFNFTASHDGVGVRPLEGLVPVERLERLCQHVRNRRGLISTRRRADGSDAPYELNISYVDAVAPDQPDDQLHARRFLATQAVMLALRGMPAVYFHSLVGTQNDYAGVAASGHPRRINRRKFSLGELRSELVKPLQQQIYKSYRHLLDVRVQQPAFHPDAEQRLVSIKDPALLAFERTSPDQQIVVLVNFAAEPRAFSLPAGGVWRDLVSGRHLREGDPLAPAESFWLVRSDA